MYSIETSWDNVALNFVFDTAARNYRIYKNSLSKKGDQDIVLHNINVFHVFIHENMKFYHQLSKQTTAFEYSSLSARKAHVLSALAAESTWAFLALKVLDFTGKASFCHPTFLTGPASFKLWTRVASSGQLEKKRFILIFLLTVAVGLSKMGSRCLDAVTSAGQHLCPVRPTCPKSDFYSNTIKKDWGMCLIRWHDPFFHFLLLLQFRANT